MMTLPGMKMSTPPHMMWKLMPRRLIADWLGLVIQARPTRGGNRWPRRQILGVQPQQTGNENGALL